MPWNFEETKLLEIKTQLKKLGTLRDYAKVKVGIQALWDKAYHIKPISIARGVLTGRSHLEDKIKIELGACRPLICNENFFQSVFLMS